MKGTKKYNFSFAGCGFLGIYYVGVTTCLKKYGHHLVLDKASGASAGAIAALLLVADIPFDASLEVLLKVANTARSKTLGPFSPSFNLGKLLGDVLEKILPEDVHIRCTGKLHISLTRVHDRHNITVSEFKSRDEVKQAILCATFIPFFSGLIPPSFRGVRYMDGGFSDNCPVRDENTVSVTPYAGESDICPRDGQLGSAILNISNTSFELSAKNFTRLYGTFFPPNPTLFYEICQQGFDDALRFLARRDLIGCQDCVPQHLQTPQYRPETAPVFSEFDMTEHFELILEAESCHECHARKKLALEDTLPPTVSRLLEDDIEWNRRGLFNWLSTFRGVKFLRFVTLPWAVSADLVLATGQKLLDVAPIPNLEPVRKLPSTIYESRLGSDYFKSKFWKSRDENLTFDVERVPEQQQQQLMVDVLPVLNQEYIDIVEEYPGNEQYMNVSPGDAFVDVTSGTRYHVVEVPLTTNEHVVNFGDRTCQSPIEFPSRRSSVVLHYN